MTIRHALLPALALVPALAANAQPTAAFEPVREARVEARDGVPMILVNGEPIHPVTFFFNTGMRPRVNDPKMGGQMRAAATAGVDVVSFVDFIDWRAPGTAPDMELPSITAAHLLEANPRALFIPRVWAEPPTPWLEAIELPEGDKVHYHDGSTHGGSLASDTFWDAFYGIYGEQVRATEQSPWGGHVLAYHYGGVDVEWINAGYREKGPDVGEAATAAFRAWLRETHGSDAALQAAWGRDDVTLDTAQVPREPSWFPIHTRAADVALPVFHKLPAERDWVDYKAFATDMTVERVLQGARAVREATGGKKLSVTFYGYAYDLPGGLGGHQGMSRVLRDPAIDVLVSPISYVAFPDRMAGGPAGFMTAVDSVALHGKMWFNEDDLRTWIIDPEKDLPHWLGEAGFGPRSASFAETRALLLRNYAAILVHRAGTWWMDLIGAGAFNDIGLWQALDEVLPLYEELLADPFPYRPEVAVIVDESSSFHRAMDYGVYMSSLPHARNAAGRTGAQVGFYYLQDFTEGLVPPCKAYIFLNAWSLDDAQVSTIHERLAEQDATAIWQFAPGLCTDQGWDPARTALVTGIPVEIAPGRLGSTGTGALESMPVATRIENVLEPRLAIVPADDVTVLAHYNDGGRPSIAMTDAPGFRSILAGEFLTDPAAVAALLEIAGAHRWTRDGEIVHTDGRVLAIHALGGDVDIHAPAGVRVVPLKGALEELAPGHYRGAFESPETRFFRLEPGQ